jgi:predicted HAD superfamily Cof-like phosphohydrolase
MRNAFLQLLEFHRAFCPEQVGTTPKAPDLDTVALRTRLMEEELRETREAMWHGDLPEIADGLADLIYVAIGTAVAYGIDLPAVWEAVHASNMRKNDGGKRADGKVLKGPNFSPPDIKAILDNQRPIEEGR